ncbi:hypothetical protein DFH06DRAFT_1126215 [Mycena polygramma]|nr:hypothetical protein DFH06DRAFT_1126215 [Mycena polygramma]
MHVTILGTRAARARHKFSTGLVSRSARTTPQLSHQNGWCADQCGSVKIRSAVASFNGTEKNSTGKKTDPGCNQADDCRYGSYLSLLYMARIPNEESLVRRIGTPSHCSRQSTVLHLWRPEYKSRRHHSVPPPFNYYIGTSIPPFIAVENLAPQLAPAIVNVMGMREPPDDGYETFSEAEFLTEANHWLNFPDNDAGHAADQFLTEEILDNHTLNVTDLDSGFTDNNVPGKVTSDSLLADTALGICLDFVLETDAAGEVITYEEFDQHRIDFLKSAKNSEDYKVKVLCDVLEEIRCTCTTSQWKMLKQG